MATRVAGWFNRGGSTTRTIGSGSIVAVVRWLEPDRRQIAFSNRYSGVGFGFVPEHFEIIAHDVDSLLTSASMEAPHTEQTKRPRRSWSPSSRQPPRLYDRRRLWCPPALSCGRACEPTFGASWRRGIRRDDKVNHATHARLFSRRCGKGRRRRAPWRFKGLRPLKGGVARRHGLLKIPYPSIISPRRALPKAKGGMMRVGVCPSGPNDIVLQSVI